MGGRGLFRSINVGPAPPTNYHTTTTVYKVNRLSDPLQSAAHLRGEAANRQQVGDINTLHIRRGGSLV